MTSRRRAFTLIELMIVVAIIGILAAIAVPKFAELIRKSQEGSTKGSLGAIRSALSIYYGDMEGQFPGQLVGLTQSGKYMGDLPFSKLAPYHDPVNVQTNRAAFPNVEYGSWWYNNAFGDAAFGVVRLNCTHTDTKGSTWTSY